MRVLLKSFAVSLIILYSCSGKESNKKNFLYLGNNKVELFKDTIKSITNYNVYNLGTKIDYREIKFEVPKFIKDTVRVLNGDTIILDEVQSDFYCGIVDTIKLDKELNLAIRIGDEQINEVNYGYVSIVNGKHYYEGYVFGNEEGVDGREELNKLMKDSKNKGASVLLSAVTFYQDSVLHTLNVGWICLTVK